MEFALVARSTDPVAIIPTMLPGQTLEIIVQAVNGSLQSVASEPVLFTMPVMAARTVTGMAVDKLQVELPAPAANGNGNGSHNGHSTNGNGRGLHVRAA
jgi:hypothetical protein